MYLEDLQVHFRTLGVAASGKSALQIYSPDITQKSLTQPKLASEKCRKVSFIEETASFQNKVLCIIHQWPRSGETKALSHIEAENINEGKLSAEQIDHIDQDSYKCSSPLT